MGPLFAIILGGGGALFANKVVILGATVCYRTGGPLLANNVIILRGHCTKTSPLQT